MLTIVISIMRFTSVGLIVTLAVFRVASPTPPCTA